MPTKNNTTKNNTPSATAALGWVEPLLRLEVARDALAKHESTTKLVNERLDAARKKMSESLDDADAYAAAAGEVRTLEVERQRLGALAVLKLEAVEQASREHELSALADLEARVVEELAALKATAETAARAVLELHAAKAESDAAAVRATTTLDQIAALARKHGVRPAVLADASPAQLKSRAFAHHVSLLYTSRGQNRGAKFVPAWIEFPTAELVVESYRDGFNIPTPSHGLASTWSLDEQARLLVEHGPAAYLEAVRAGVRPAPKPIAADDDPAVALGIELTERAQRRADLEFASFGGDA